MAKFLTTLATNTAIERLIANANNTLLIISPYLQMSTLFFDRLSDAIERGVQVTFVYRESDLNPQEERKLDQLGDVRLLCLENLHAKCYSIDDAMIITSMNFYEFSQNKNREMGVLLRPGDDGDAFDDAMQEVESILRAAERNSEHSPSRRSQDRPESRSSRSRPRQHEQSGHCIRCRVSILANPRRPYCDDCYSSWAQWENWSYEEEYCHICGSPAATSMGKPLCYDCFMQSIRQ